MTGSDRFGVAVVVALTVGFSVAAVKSGFDPVPTAWALMGWAGSIIIFLSPLIRGALWAANQAHRLCARYKLCAH